LADAIAPEYRALVYSAAYLGCRWSELVGLKRQHLNLLKRQVAIVGTLEEVRGALRYVEQTKSSASRRTLTLPRFLVDVLAAHLEQAPPSEFVFTGRDGGLLRRSNFRRRHFKPALARAGLDTRLRPHDMRHTCAALLIEQGAHPKEIQARLGHASITTTLNTYGHLMPGLGAKLDDALDRAYLQAAGDDSRPIRGLASVATEESTSQ
jgi:integrase